MKVLDGLRESLFSLCRPPPQLSPQQKKTTTTKTYKHCVFNSPIFLLSKTLFYDDHLFCLALFFPQLGLLQKPGAKKCYPWATLWISVEQVTDTWHHTPESCTLPRWALWPGRHRDGIWPLHHNSLPHPALAKTHERINRNNKRRIDLTVLWNIP